MADSWRDSIWCTRCHSLLSLTCPHPWSNGQLNPNQIPMWCYISASVGSTASHKGILAAGGLPGERGNLSPCPWVSSSSGNGSTRTRASDIVPAQIILPPSRSPLLPLFSLCTWHTWSGGPLGVHQCQQEGSNFPDCTAGSSSVFPQIMSWFLFTR